MEYDISHVTEESKRYLPSGYQGHVFRLASYWLPIIPLPTEPTKIMEIGTYHGANLCSLLRTYASPEGSVIHCVDPWIDYDGYDEYHNHQSMNYHTMIQNISKLSPSDLHKIYLHRGLSGEADRFLPPGLYDIIYVDGNHTLRYVLEDIVLSMKRIKKGGWIIIDDLQCPDVVNVIQRTLPIYEGVIDTVQNHSGQLFIRMK